MTTKQHSRYKRVLNNL